LILIDSQSRITSECFLLKANDPLHSLIPVRAREQAIEDRIDHWGDRFVVLTNLDAVDFRVMSAPLDNPGIWTEIIPHVVGQRIGIAEFGISAEEKAAALKGLEAAFSGEKGKFSPEAFGPEIQRVLGGRQQVAQARLAAAADVLARVVVHAAAEHERVLRGVLRGERADAGE
jgi:hypothetical protein